MAEKTEKPQSETAAKKAGVSATASAAPKSKAAAAKPKSATAKSTTGAKATKSAAKPAPKPAPKEAKPKKTSAKPKATAQEAKPAPAKASAKSARKDVAKIKIRYYRSAIGRSYRQKRVVQGLGLRKLNQVVERPDDAAIRGMVAKIPHLVEIVQGD